VGAGVQPGQQFLDELRLWLWDAGVLDATEQQRVGVLDLGNDRLRDAAPIAIRGRHTSLVQQLVATEVVLHRGRVHDDQNRPYGRSGGISRYLTNGGVGRQAETASVGRVQLGDQSARCHRCRETDHHPRPAAQIGQQGGRDRSIGGDSARGTITFRFDVAQLHDF